MHLSSRHHSRQRVLVLTCWLLLDSYIALAAAQTPVTILPPDPRITYAPPPCGIVSHQVSVEPCPGTWGDIIIVNGEQVRIASDPSPTYGNITPTFSFEFQGSALELHGCLDNSGATIGVALDGKVMQVNTSSGAGSSIVQRPYTAWSALGLDTTRNHTLDVTFVPSYRTTFIYFEYLVVVPPPPTNTTTPTKVGANDANGSSKNINVAAVVSGSVLGFAGLLAIVAASFYALRARRRIRAASGQSSIVVLPESPQERGTVTPFSYRLGEGDQYTVGAPFASHPVVTEVTSPTGAVADATSSSATPTWFSRKARGPPPYTPSDPVSNLHADNPTGNTTSSQSQ